MNTNTVNGEDKEPQDEKKPQAAQQVQQKPKIVDDEDENSKFKVKPLNVDR